MEYETISALRIDIYECREKAPSEILQPYKPRHYKNYAWIPQTIGDQIWVLFEFDTIEQRQKWEGSLPPSISKWLDRKLIEYAINYGWHVRNINGFTVR